MIKAVLFDLDGTLLPMDIEKFLKLYLSKVSTVVEGSDPREVAKNIMRATAVVQADTDPNTTNEEVFWREFLKLTNYDMEKVLPLFHAFYENEFPKLGEHFPGNPEAKRAVLAAKARGFRCILATNPLFPIAATNSRVRWAGLSPDDFELITAYEDSRSAKPSDRYYLEVIERAGGLLPGECLMVGNDEAEDLIPARKLGLMTFLLTDDAIRSEEAKAEAWDGEGGFEELIKFISNIA